MLLMPILLCAGALTGCGGGGSSAPSQPGNPGTPAGAYTVTVKATATAGSSTVIHTASFTLDVQ